MHVTKWKLALTSNIVHSTSSPLAPLPRLT